MKLYVKPDHYSFRLYVCCLFVIVLLTELLLNFVIPTSHGPPPSSEPRIL